MSRKEQKIKGIDMILSARQRPWLIYNNFPFLLFFLFVFVTCMPVSGAYIRYNITNAVSVNSVLNTTNYADETALYEGQSRWLSYIDIGDSQYSLNKTFWFKNSAMSPYPMLFLNYSSVFDESITYDNRPVATGNVCGQFQLTSSTAYKSINISNCTGRYFELSCSPYGSVSALYSDDASSTLIPYIMYDNESLIPDEDSNYLNYSSNYLDENGSISMSYYVSNSTTYFGELHLYHYISIYNIFTNTYMQPYLMSSTDFWDNPEDIIIGQHLDMYQGMIFNSSYYRNRTFRLTMYINDSLGSKIGFLNDTADSSFITCTENCTPLPPPPIPTPSPTYTPFPTYTPPPDTNYTDFNGSGIGNISDQMANISTDSLDTINDSISGINDYIQDYNYSISKTIIAPFLSTILGIIPKKIWGVIILGWVLLLSLWIIKGR